MLLRCNFFKSSAHMASGCWFFRALWLPLMLTVAAAEQCSGSAKKCGNTTISHPFWLPDWETGRSCGYPEFEASCLENRTTPVILNSAAISLGFAILNISYEERSLHAVDLGKRYLLQHAPNICQAVDGRLRQLRGLRRCRHAGGWGRRRGEREPVRAAHQ